MGAAVRSIPSPRENPDGYGYAASVARAAGWLPAACSCDFRFRARVAIDRLGTNRKEQVVGCEYSKLSAMSVPDRERNENRVGGILELWLEIEIVHSSERRARKLS